MLKLSLYSELGVTTVDERGVFSKDSVYRLLGYVLPEDSLTFYKPPA